MHFLCINAHRIYGCGVVVDDDYDVWWWVHLTLSICTMNSHTLYHHHHRAFIHYFIITVIIVVVCVFTRLSFHFSTEIYVDIHMYICIVIRTSRIHWQLILFLWKPHNSIESECIVISRVRCNMMCYMPNGSCFQCGSVRFSLWLTVQNRITFVRVSQLTSVRSITLHFFQYIVLILSIELYSILSASLKHSFFGAQAYSSIFESIQIKIVQFVCVQFHNFSQKKLNKRKIN